MGDTTKIKELADKKTLDSVEAMLTEHDQRLSGLDDKVSLIEEHFHNVHNTYEYNLGESNISTPSQPGYLLYDDGVRIRFAKQKLYYNDEIILDNTDEFTDFYQLFYPYIYHKGVPSTDISGGVRPSIYNFKRSGDSLYLYVYFKYYWRTSSPSYYKSYHYYFEYDLETKTIKDHVEGSYFFTSGGSVELNTSAADAFIEAPDDEHIYISSKYTTSKSSSRTYDVKFLTLNENIYALIVNSKSIQLVRADDKNNKIEYYPAKQFSNETYDYNWTGSSIYNVITSDKGDIISTSGVTGTPYNIVYYNETYYICTLYNNKTYLYEIDLNKLIISDLVTYIIPYTNVCNCDLTENLYVGKDSDDYTKLYTIIEVTDGDIVETNSLITVRHLVAESNGCTLVLDSPVNINSSFIISPDNGAYFAGTTGKNVYCPTAGRIQVVTFN